MFMENIKTHMKNPDKEIKEKAKVTFTETDEEVEEDGISIIQSEDEYEDAVIELDSSEDTEPESSTHQQIEDSRKKRSTKEKVQPILRKSTRERKPVQREGYVSLFTVEKAEEEPDSPQEALNGSHKRKWNEAMKREYKSLKYNGTWESRHPRGRRF